jgi:hypothetical protein
VDILAAGTDIGGVVSDRSISTTGNAPVILITGPCRRCELCGFMGKAGLMARESLEPKSRFVAALATPSMNGAFFEYRELLGASAIMAGGFQVNYPETWLRLKRAGSAFVGYASYDGETWVMLGSSYFQCKPSIRWLCRFQPQCHPAVTAELRDWALVGTNAVMGVVTRSARAIGAFQSEVSHFFLRDHV